MGGTHDRHADIIRVHISHPLVVLYRSTAYFADPAHHTSIRDGKDSSLTPIGEERTPSVCAIALWGAYLRMT